MTGPDLELLKAQVLNTIDEVRKDVMEEIEREDADADEVPTAAVSSLSQTEQSSGGGSSAGAGGEGNSSSLPESSGALLYTELRKKTVHHLRQRDLQVTEKRAGRARKKQSMASEKPVVHVVARIPTSMIHGAAEGEASVGKFKCLLTGEVEQGVDIDRFRVFI